VRKLILLGGLTALLLGTQATGASATTWNGDCTMKGVGKFHLPYKLVPEYNSYEGRATGTCAGTLNGKPYKGLAHSYIDGRMSEPMSCELGLPRNVPAILTFGRLKSVRSARLHVLSVLSPRSFGEQVVQFSGAYNGHGYGHMSFHTGLPALQACTFGPGVAQADYDIDVHTLGTVFG
jgi:hypothetical protein